jgi:hypothetical protein
VLATARGARRSDRADVFSRQGTKDTKPIVTPTSSSWWFKILVLGQSTWDGDLGQIPAVGQLHNREFVPP